ncbi:MAG TPA: hypothetical protein VHT24_05785 [Pseudacidobacterium sp.]|jgi:hypothetical protein|nr:hypothetical protein [Pseudacidobacterium sp.]
MKQLLRVGLSSALLVFAGSFLLAAQDAPQTKSIQLVGARAELNKGLDAKKAKQGDPVTVKLTDAVKIPDSTELPKNTVLIGHVDQVQPSENKGDSVIQVTFDKAQLKDGQQLPIKATIMQIAPPVNAMMNQSASAASGPSPMPGAPAASGGGANPSGTSGGAGGMQSAPAPSMAASVPTSDQSQQSKQGVPGVELRSDIRQSDSGTFIAKGKNVHLPDGTQMQIALAVIPPNTQIK